MNLSPIPAAFLLASSILREVDDDDPRPVTVVVAGKIHTMDPGWPVVSAVAVWDGKIPCVGTRDGVKLSLG
jgi:hypothetical protein